MSNRKKLRLPTHTRRCTLCERAARPDKTTCSPVCEHICNLAEHLVDIGVSTLGSETEILVTCVLAARADEMKPSE